MYSYTVIQWLFFFYFYCFFGWCFESTYVSIVKRRWVNRGFMRGPFLPLYGSGAIMMLVVSSPFQSNLFLVYLSGCVGATVLEYVTGVVMEALFKVRYWDYSNQKFNYKGRICLSSTIAWGFLTLLMTQVVHKPVEMVVLSIPGKLLTIATIVLTVLIATDFALAFKAALDLKDILVKLDKAREEMERLQRRLDVIVAVANEDLEAKRAEKEKEKEARRAERELRMDELAARIEEQLSRIKEGIQNRPSSYTDSLRDEFTELKTRFSIGMENRAQLKNLKPFDKFILSGNPTIVSRKFKESLEELKNARSERGRKDRGED